jgi:ABC-type antimicrobial peptide transport system permease subunit
LLFAAIGTYGLLSYVVSQRTREIGIRLALGAEPARILAAVVRGGLLLALPGVVVGLVLTLMAGRFMRSLVVGVSLTDPVTLGGAGVLLLIVAAVACFIPGWRASRVDPVVTLTSD